MVKGTSVLKEIFDFVEVSIYAGQSLLNILLPVREHLNDEMLRVIFTYR